MTKRFVGVSVIWPLRGTRAKVAGRRAVEPWRCVNLQCYRCRCWVMSQLSVSP